MNLKYKKLIAIIAIILVVIVVFAIVFMKTNKNNQTAEPQPTKQENTYMENGVLHINQTISYDGLEISNFEIEKLDSKSCEIRATVENNSENIIEVENINLKLYDAKGQLLDVVGAQIDSVDAYGITTLYARLIRKDISEIYKIVLEEN